MKTPCQRIRDIILSELKKYDPYVYYEARTGSIYIKFKPPHDWVGSIRIADHTGIAKYTYKWNITASLSYSHTKFDRGVERFFFPFHSIDIMCKELERRLEITGALKEFNEL